MQIFEFKRSPQSNDETEVMEVLLKGEKVGILKAFRATEEEAKMIKTKLKRKVEIGQVYSIKVILNKTMSTDELNDLNAAVEEKYPSLPLRKYFILQRGSEIIPLKIKGD